MTIYPDTIVSADSPGRKPDTGETQNAAPAGQSENPAYPKALNETEIQLLRIRRQVTDQDGPVDNQVGFGLSGGGIRSATFCLGVFQGLAKQKLLAKIDYLSTVSGGGYFGAFYGRLFTRGQITTPEDVEDILKVTSASDERAAPSPGKLPKGKVFRWLRENGRYLAPSGTGDVLLAGAVMLRNFVAVHLVLATFILMIFIAAQLFREAVEISCRVGQDYPCAWWWHDMQIFFRNHLPGGQGFIWWSPYAVWVPVIVLFAVVPPAWCYWLVEKPNPRTAGKWIPPFYGWLATFSLGLLGMIASAAAASATVLSPDQGKIIFWTSLVVFMVASETFIWSAANGYFPRLNWRIVVPDEKQIFHDENLRRRLSKQLSTALMATGGVLAFVVIDSLAQTFYGAALLDQFRPKVWLTAIFGPLIGLAGFGRIIVSSFGGKTAGKTFSIPLTLVTGTAALALVTLLLVTLDASAYLIAWSAKMPLGPRPDWTVAEGVNQAKRLEVRPISFEGPKPPTCPDERSIIGTVAAVDARTGTLRVRAQDNDFNLIAAYELSKNGLEEIKLGDPVQVWYRARNGNLTASAISAITEASGLSSSEGWRISAPTQKPSKFSCGSRKLEDLYLSMGALGIAFLFSFLFGWSWPFLNRSTHQPIYTSRLIRAYLGASNPDRLAGYGTSVTQPIEGDDIKQEDYWPRFKRLTDASDSAKLGEIRDAEKTLLEKGMPLHLVNVTINETFDARLQVEQRDRKGIGMAIGPAGISAGVVHHVVVTDNQYQPVVYPRPDGKDAYQIFRYPGGFNFEFLTLGNWTGISGAAFSTSLGWRTSLAFSLLAGLANVRLTYWWNSAVKPMTAGMHKRLWRRGPSQVFQTLFTVQNFLFGELLARYYGTARQWWPLSDGGHFENLGGYELIRRRLPVIVIVDAEADPDYTFEGLANLVRKARLDFGAEIRFLSETELDAKLDPEIRKNFGSIEQLRRGVWVQEPVKDPNAPEAEKDAPVESAGRKARWRRSINPIKMEALSLAHAALAEVIYDDASRATLLYIKPTLIGDEPADVHRYHTEHPSFPHESTLQQFFDEAQWESYRKLGEHIAKKLFREPPASAAPENRQKFWPHRLVPAAGDSSPSRTPEATGN